MTQVFDTDASPGLELAKIIEIDPQTYTCTVVTIAEHREITNVKFAVPYLGPDRGAGINIMPEVDAFCYVQLPPDGSGAFIWGFTMIEDPDESNRQDHTDEEGPSYRGERPPLEPGDLALTTKDGNFLYIRRGGIIQIGASQLAQRVYIPIENVIRDYFVRYHGFSPFGEIIWDHSMVTKDSVNSGDIAAIVKFSCKERAFDSKNSIEVRVGHLSKDLLDATIDSNLLQSGNPNVIDEEAYTGEGDQEHIMGAKKAHTGLGFEPDPDNKDLIGMFSITVNPKGEGVKYTFQIGKDGSNFIRSAAHIHVETEKSFFVHANKDDGARIETDTDTYIEIKDYVKAVVKQALLEILANGDVKLAGNNIQLDAKGNITIKAPTSILLEAAQITLAASDIKLGKGASMDLLANASAFLDALKNHQHSYVSPDLTSIGPTLVTTPAGTVLPGAKTTTQTGAKVKV